MTYNIYYPQWSLKGCSQYYSSHNEWNILYSILKSFILKHSLPVQDAKSLVHGSDTHCQYALLSGLAEFVMYLHGLCCIACNKLSLLYLGVRHSDVNMFAFHNPQYLQANTCHLHFVSEISQYQCLLYHNTIHTLQWPM